jgi:hypothetical protein
MINLLPTEEKKILKMEEKWRLILLLGILILSSFLCLILILYSIKIYASSKAESQKAAIEITGKEFEKPETKELKEKISAANKNIIDLNNFYQNQVYLTDTLEKISSNLPLGAYITTFSCQKQVLEKEQILRITLSGFAPDEDTLFKLGKNLEKNFSTKVTIIEESWINPSEFQLSFEIKINK